jgi:hypothetical protein
MDTIVYSRLTEEGDEKATVNVDEARKLAKADLAGHCPIPEGPTGCPLIGSNGKLKKMVKTPRLVAQKKKGEEKMKVVTDPKQITEKTEKIISTPEPNRG